MNKDQQFQQSISDKLNTKPLDVKIQNRIRAARIKALDSGESRLRQGWLPVTALASFLALVVVVMVSRIDSNETLFLEQPDDLAIISSEDSLELYQNLEFYVWLDQDQSV